MAIRDRLRSNRAVVRSCVEMERGHRSAPANIPGIEAEVPFDGHLQLAEFRVTRLCCRGAYSNYNIRVGRSSSLSGPYVDDRGVPMLAGGGTLVLEGSGARRGPGHNAVLRDDGDLWRLVFHYYDAANAGTATLGIRPISWTADGWPAVAW